MTSTSITAFFKPKPTEPEPEMLHWKTMKKITGTTSCVEVHLKARVGATVTHTVHGKVKLVGQPTPGKLEIEIEKINIDNYRNNWKSITREIVDAALCSNPTALARARDPSVYLQENDNTRTIQAKMKAVRKARFLLEQALVFNNQGIKSAKAKGKEKAGSTTSSCLSIEPAAGPNKGGRPKGSKDKAPRKSRGCTPAQFLWEYGGTKYQVAAVGATVMHDGFGQAVLLGQPDDKQLQLQLGAKGKEYVVTVASCDCYVVDEGSHATPVNPDQAGSSDAGASGAGASSTADVPAPKRRKSGGRKRKERNQKKLAHGLHPLSTKAEVERVRKRQKREEAAKKRGMPLKPSRIQKNRTWPAELKAQAVQIYLSSFAPSKQWEACRKHLLSLPGFVGLERGHVQAWVGIHISRASQEPNEYGLIVTKAGRPPVVPEELYEELKQTILALARTRAMRVCATSMIPIVRPIVIHRLGAEVIRPGKGGFMVGHAFIKKLAHDAGLKWRKPYGDARKPPPDAEAQIEDMRRRLAYLMKEHMIPRALVLNFDHTGMHFIQQRGNTFTEVTEDEDGAHKSRAGKQKETKLKGAQVVQSRILSLLPTSDHVELASHPHRH